MRRLILIVAASAVGGFAGTAAAAAAPVSIAPSADTYVRSDHPRSNYGRRTQLYVQGRGAVRRAYLRFNVGVSAGWRVTKATLRLYATTPGGPVGVTLRGAGGGIWSERSLAWRTRPALGARAVDTAARYSDRSWIELDATPLVRNSGPVNMALTAASGRKARRVVGFRSREVRNRSPVLTVTTEPLPGSAPGAAPGGEAPNPGVPGGGTPNPGGPPYSVRGVYDRDFSATGFDDEARIGFNYIDSGPQRDQMDALAARGLKGFVWLGGFSGSKCDFNESDDWVRSHVRAIAGHPGVGAYFIDDEPEDVTAGCPLVNVPARIKARADLVRTLDPGRPTFIVVHRPERLAEFAGTVDVIGLDHYPCSYKNGCVYSKIDDQAAEADRLGVRYWGVVQAYGEPACYTPAEEPWYRLPTPGELHEQFNHWRTTHMEGYLVFAWHYPECDPSFWLANHPELREQLANENR